LIGLFSKPVKINCEEGWNSALSAEKTGINVKAAIKRYFHASVKGSLRHDTALLSEVEITENVIIG
jgi:hypothetical protein